MDNNYQSENFIKDELLEKDIDTEQQASKPRMFKNCFSFEGRIRRLEYVLSEILYFIGVYIIMEIDFFIDTPIILLLYAMFVVSFPLFLLSQRTRRCHDLGHNGWWQLIPFYVFWLLFENGELGSNKYGENPKGEVKTDCGASPQ